MGKILSKYRRVKSPSEELEGLEEEIKTIEDRHKSALESQKKFVSRFLFYGIALYVLAVVCLYTLSLFKPIYVAGIVSYPILLYFAVNIVNWGYRRYVSREKDQLIQLRGKKKKILNEVMDKETYKVAMEILEKYAPDQLRKHGVVSPKAVKTQQLLPKPQPPQTVDQTVVQRPNISPIRGGFRPSPPRRKLVRPILPQDRGVFERFIDAVVGDGLSYRYALICANCASHNGMALPDDFEYLAFRCAYCNFPNPSKKVRPRSSSSPSPSRATPQGDVSGSPGKLAEESSSSVEQSEEKEESTEQAEPEPVEDSPVEKETDSLEQKKSD